MTSGDFERQAGDQARQSREAREQAVQILRAARQYIESAMTAEEAAQGVRSAAQQLAAAMDNRMAEFIAAVQMTGSGTLTASGTVAIPGAAALSGEGHLTVGGVAARAGATVISGGPVHISASDSGAATEGMNVVKVADIGGLFTKAAQDGIYGFSILQLLVLILTCAIVFGLPFLERVLPPEARSDIASEKDGIEFVCSLIAAAIVANRKPKR